MFAMTRTGLRPGPVPVLFQMGGGGVGATQVSKTFLIQASKADLEGARWSLLALATDLPLFGPG